MNPDFDSSIVLANTAQVLRAEILNAVHEESAHITLVQVIAVIESHLAQLAADEPDVIDGASSGAALMEHDGPMLRAFNRRLPSKHDDVQDGSRDDPT